MPPQRRPSSHRRIQQIVRSDTRLSVREVSLNIWENWS
jgi:hypothetical protein